MKDDILEWQAGLLDLNPGAGEYDFDGEDSKQKFDRMVAWQDMLETLVNHRDVIEVQVAEEKRNARDAFRAVVTEFSRTTMSHHMRRRQVDDMRKADVDHSASGSSRLS